MKLKLLGRIWCIFGVAFIIWVWITYSARGVSKNLFENSSLVKVHVNKNFISFTPLEPFNKVLIFYPGALVDPIAYAPLCRKIADCGYKTILIKMPWRMANYGYKQPKELRMFEDDTKQYILAGHSMGAKMAAQFTYENPAFIKKLILMGTTHPRDIDLSKLNIPVLKIYGSNDGVANMDDVNSNKPKLPLTTEFVLIKGANHSQFGHYGSQIGDDKAYITREKQQEIIVNSILTFIK
jgi:hypothetical protein